MALPKHASPLERIWHYTYLALCVAIFVFLMAPIHHHYEKKGWAEPTIVIRFWIISLILALIGLATLKLR